ncbi:MAG: bifunctional folylpolyglutamate synthase/dihydrofolate synthase [Clostridia bacterium]|nr:bifunctional folylpolyglutamate synthase/dihydrofolate synthase [Clostridia bacterium]
MTYTEALDYIHSVCWTFTKPGLSRISELCEKLGNPQKSLKFIHVAGTNGKGSFCSMLDSVLRAAGYKTGLFTSPYVKVFNERMRVNGENIPDQTLAAITEAIRPIADSMEDKPTEFELITAIGFEYFKREQCDFVILEAGMGGRLDSTNIIDSSLLSVITGISLDHTAYLGDTVEKIAAEKAGIIKPGGTVLFCGNSESVEAVVENRAKEVGAAYRFADKSSLCITDSNLDGCTFDFGSYRSLRIALLGLYQPQNAANVLCAVDVLREKGVYIPDSAVREGLLAARWPARFEILSNAPLLLFDGAHNPEGIEAAVNSVKQYFGNCKICVLTGVMRDKDYRYIASKLSEIAHHAFVITPDNPRALPANEYAEVLAECGMAAIPFSTVEEAFAHAMAFAQSTNTPLICLGSLYMYCEITGLLEARN